MPKVYCKYCYKYVGLEAGDGIWMCSNCGYGLAPLDFGGHPSFKKMKECAEFAFAVMNEGLEHFQLKGTGEDMSKCYPKCPHEERGNKTLYDLPLLISMRKSVGLPDKTEWMDAVKA